MLEWMILPFKRYFDFKGRSRRKEFWHFFLLNVIVIFVLWAIVLGVGGGMQAMMTAATENPGNPMAVYGTMFSGAGVLILLWGLVTFIPNIAVAVRRLHDRDMSGWWYLGFIVLYLIPFVNFVAGIAFIVLMCLEGTKGPNRFGPDPKDPAAAEVFA